MLTKRSTYILVIIAAVMFGLMPLIVMHLYDFGLSSNQIVFWRYIFASLIMLPFAKFEKIGWRVMLKMAFLGILGYGMTTVLLFASFQYIPTSQSMTLHFLYPFFVIVGGLIMGRGKPTKKQLLAMVCGLFGIVLILSPSEFSLNFYGIILSVLSAITYAFALLMLEDKSVSNVPFKLRLFYIYLFSAVMAGVLMSSQNNYGFQVNIVTISLLVFLAIGCSIVAIGLMAYAVPKAGSTNAAILSLFEPLTSAVAGVMLLGESMGILGAMGIVIVLSSSVIVMTVGKKE